MSNWTYERDLMILSAEETLSHSYRWKSLCWQPLHEMLCFFKLWRSTFKSMWGTTRQVTESTFRTW